MALYAACDLHSNNTVLAVVDAAGALRYRQRLPNDLPLIDAALAPFRSELSGVAVESTYNAYWLIDGLQTAGYRHRWSTPWRYRSTPGSSTAMTTATLKAIHAAEDLEAAQAKADQVVAKLRAMKLGAAADKVEAGIAETFAYYAFPETHWRRIRTNNPLERMMREIRRRTRVVGAFPDGHAALMLAAARLRYLAGTHWGAKRYLCMEQLNKRQALTTVAA